MANYTQAVQSHSTLEPIQLVFIDSAVQDIQSLIGGVVADAQVVVLHPEVDGVMQLTQVLQAQPNIGTIHLVAHGVPGCLRLGNAQLSLETLEGYAAQLRTWFEGVPSQQGQILLYGCHVAAGEIGAEFVQKLHQLTGVAIAASTTAIGNTAAGGNWELDVRLEGAATQVKTELPLVFRAEAMAAYAGVLNAAPPSLSGPLPFDVLENQWRTLTISDLLAGITDPDNDPLTISNLTASAGTILNRSDGGYSYIPPVNYLGEITFTYDVSDGQNPPIQQTRTLEIVEASYFAVYSITAGGGGFVSNQRNDFNQKIGVPDSITVYWDYDADGNVIASARSLNNPNTFNLRRDNPNILNNDIQSDRNIFGIYIANGQFNEGFYSQYYAISGFQATNNPPRSDGLGNLTNAFVFLEPRLDLLGGVSQDIVTGVFTGLFLDISGYALGLLNLSNPELKFALEQGKPITESYAYGVYYEGDLRPDAEPLSFFALRSFDPNPVTERIDSIYGYYNYVTLSLERNAPPVITPKSLSLTEDAGEFYPDFQSTIQVVFSNLLEGLQDEFASSSSDPNGWFYRYGVVGVDGVPGLQTLGQSILYVDGDISDVVLFDSSHADYQHLAQGATKTIVGSYTVQDDFFKTATAPLTVTITGVNDAPVAVADTASGLTNQIITGSVATNDYDVDDGAILTYSLIAAVDGLTLNADGSYSLDTAHPTYRSLPAGQTLSAIANYRVTDEFGAFSNSTLTFTLTGANVNTAPTVTGETVSTSQNTGNPVTSVTVELGDNLSDPDGLDNAILNVTGTTNGTIASIDQDARLITFTPTAGFSGTASFNYTLTDAGGLTSNTATVTVEVGSIISTSSRNQVIEGNNGNDIISAGNGNDRILGLGGNDKLYGNNGDDFLDGGDGNDSLFGGNGADTLLGGNGDDLLDGGNGPDILTGGPGADLFVLTATAGGDTITDFEDTVDRIALSGGLTFGQLTIAGNAGNTAILLGKTTLATLLGVSSDLITAADFVTL